jgi:hypothetical protein
MRACLGVQWKCQPTTAPQGVSHATALLYHTSLVLLPLAATRQPAKAALLTIPTGPRRAASPPWSPVSALRFATSSKPQRPRALTHAHFSVVANISSVVGETTSATETARSVSAFSIYSIHIDRREPLERSPLRLGSGSTCSSPRFSSGPMFSHALLLLSHLPGAPPAQALHGTVGSAHPRPARRSCQPFAGAG